MHPTKIFSFTVLQVPDVLDARFTAQLRHMPWMFPAFLTDDLPESQELVCQQVATLSHHQLAGLWQASISSLSVFWASV